MTSGSKEYIDIFDFFRFLWRAKFFILIGALSGLVFSLILTSVVWPPLHIYRIPIEGKKTSRKSVFYEQLNEQLQKIFSEPSAVGAFYDEIGARSPGLRTKLETAGLTKEKWINLELSNRSKFLRPFTFAKNTTSTELDFRVPFSLDPSWKAPEAIADAMNAVINKEQTTVLERLEQSKKEAVLPPERSRKIVDKAQDEYLNIAKQKYSSDLQIIAEYSGLEFNILEALRAKKRPDCHLGDKSMGDVDARIAHLLGIAIAARCLTKAEAKSFYDQYGVIHAGYDINSLRQRDGLGAATTELQQAFTMQHSSTEPADSSIVSDFYVLSLDQKDLDRLQAAEDFETIETKHKVIVPVTVIIGIFTSLFVFLVLGLFVKKS